MTRTRVSTTVDQALLAQARAPIGRRSAVNLDAVESVSTAVLVDRLGTLSGARMHDICAALEVAVDCA